MPNTETALLGLTLMATGENNNEWNDIINNEIILPCEQAIAGTLHLVGYYGESTTGHNTANIDGYKIIKIDNISSTGLEPLTLTSTRNGHATSWFIINESVNGMVVVTIGDATVSVPFGNRFVFYTGGTSGSSASRIWLR